MNSGESATESGQTIASTSVGEINKKRSLFLSFYKHKNLAFAGVFVFLVAGFFAVTTLNANKVEAAACNATGSGTWGGASDTASFTSCTGSAPNGTGTGNRPATTDTITINAGVALTLAGNVQVAGITIAAQSASNSPLTMSTFTLTNTGTLVCSLAGTNTVTTTIAIGSGTLSNTGLITLNAGATSKICTITWTTGTLTASGGITFTGSTPTLNNTGAGTFNFAGVMSSGGTVTINSGTTMNITGNATINGARTVGNLTISSGILTLGAALTVAGNWTNNSSTSALTGNFAVTMSGASKTIGGSFLTPFYGLSIGNTGSITLNTNATVGAGNFSFASGTGAASFTHASGIGLTVNGTATVTAPTGAVTKAWNINAGTATVTGATTIGGNVNTASRISKITLTSGTANFAALTFKTGTTDVQVANAVLEMTGAANVNISGVITRANLGTITPGTTSTVTYNGTAAQTIPMGTASNTFWGACTTQCYANLVVNNTNASGATLGNTVSSGNISGNLTIGNGSAAAIFNNGGFAITGTVGDTFSVTNNATFNMTGTSTYPTGFSTFTYGATSTVNFKQTNGTSIPVATYGHLGLLPAGATSLVLGTGASQTITIAGNLTIGNGTNAGATGATNNPDISVGGTLSISNNATFVTGSGTITLSGSTSPVISRGATASVFTASTGNTVVLTGSGTFSIINNANTFTGTSAFYNLTVNGTGTYSIDDKGFEVKNELNVLGGATLTDSSSGGQIAVGSTSISGSGKVKVSSTSALTLITGAMTQDTSTGGSLCLGSTGATCSDTTAGTITIKSLALNNAADATRTISIGGSGTTVTTQQTTLGLATFNAGSSTLIFTGNLSSTPFGCSYATFNPGTSTVKYTNTAAFTVCGTTYYNLEVSPGADAVTGSFDANVNTFSGNGTFVTGNLTIGAGTGSSRVVSANTNATTTLDVNGNFQINANTTFVSNASNPFTIGGNFTNNGTFTHSNGTVTLDTTTQADVTGSTSFYSLTISNGGAGAKTVRFGYGNTFTIGSGGAGVLTITGAVGKQITLTSTDPTTSNWTINHQGTESITYTTINYGTCHASSTNIDVSGTGNVQGTGNSGSCWTWPSSGITVSGTIYQQDGSTADGTGYTILISTGGGTTTQTTSNGSGVWQFTSYAAPTAGNNLFIWKNGGGASLVLKYGTTGCSGGNCTGLSLVTNRVTIQNAHTGSVTNSDLGQCDPDSGFGCSTPDIGYSVGASDDLSVNDGMMLSIAANTSFTPGGTVSTSPTASQSSNDGDVLTAGGSTLDMGTNALSIGGDFGMFGTFTLSSGQTTTFTATTTGIGLNVAGGTFENVVFNGVGGGWQFSQDKVLNGDLTMTNGTLSGTGSLTVNGGDVTGNGTINLTGGTVTLTGAGSFGGNTAWTFNALAFNGASSTTTTTGSGSITATANNSAVTIGASHTLNAGSKTWNLSGTGTPFVATGAFTPSGSIFHYSGSGATVASRSNGGTTISYYILETMPSSSTAQVLGTNSGDTINVSFVFTIGDGSVGHGGATGATYNPIVNTNYIEIRNYATYTTGSGTLSVSSCANGSAFDRKTSGVFTATTGNTTVFTCTNTTGQASILSNPMTGSNAFYNLTIDGDGGGDNFSLGQTVEVTNDLTVSAGDNLTGTANLTVNGVVGGTGVINLSGGTFAHNTGSTTKNFGSTANWNFNNLTLSGASGTTTATSTSNITIAGTLTIDTSHTLNAGSKTWIINGAYANTGNDLTPGTSTFSFRGTGSDIDNRGGYYNLDFSPTSGTQNYNLIGGVGGLTINNLTLAGAGNAIVNMDDEVGNSLDINGDVTIGSGDTLQFGAVDPTVGGSWSNSGTFTHGNVNVNFDSTDAANIDAGSSPFYSATFNHPTGAWTLTNNMTVSNILTISNGNLDASSRTITLSGSGTPFVKSGGTFTYGTSTVNYTGTSATNVLALNGASTTDAYYNLGLGTTSDITAVIYTMPGSTTVNGTVTVGNAGSTGIDYLALGATTLTLKGSGTPLSPVSGKGGVLSETSTVQYTSGSGVAALSTVVANFNNLVINGTGTFNTGVNLNIGGDLTVTSGTLLGTTNIEVQGGDVTGNGIINMSGSSSFAAWGTGNFGGNSNWVFAALQISEEPGYTQTATGSGSVTVATLNLNGTLNAGSKTWTITGVNTPFASGGGTLNAQTSTFEFTGAGATTIPAYSYYNLSIKPGADAATHTLGTGASQAFVVGNNLVIGDGTHTGVTVSATSYNPTIDVNGTGTSVDIKANTTFVTPNNTFTVAGSWSNAGTVTSAGTITFDAASGSKTITNGTGSYSSMTFDGGATWTIQNPLTLSANLVVQNGTFTSSQNIDVSGNVVDNGGSGVINMTGGTFTVIGSASFTNTGAAWNFNNLAFGGNFGTHYSSGNGVVNVAGQLTIGVNHTLDAGTKEWRLSGSGTPLYFTNGTAALSANSSKFTYNSPTGVTALSNLAMTGSNAFYDLEIAGSGQTFNAGVDIQAINSVYVSAGTLAMGANNLHMGQGGSSSTLLVDVGQSLTQDSAATTYFTEDGGTHIVNGPGTITLGNVQVGVDGSGAQLSLQGATTVVTVSGVLTNQNKSDVSGNSSKFIFTANGTPIVNYNTFNVGSATVEYASAGTSGTTVYGNIGYGSLILNKAGNTFTTDGDIVIDKDFTLQAGTFVAPYSMSIGGDFINNGTFTHNNGTVNIFSTYNNKVSQVGGSANTTTFYILTATNPGSTLQFANGKTYVFNSQLEVLGSSGNPVWLRSNLLNSQWTVTFSGTVTLDYVNVQDAACSGGNTLTRNYRVYDQGNNGSCWNIFVHTGGGGASGGGAGSSGHSNSGGGVGGSGSVQATATATISNGSVNTISVEIGGSGYTTAPTVCLVGGGYSARATAIALLTGTSVTGFTITSGGTGYGTIPTVSIGAPPGDGGSGCSSEAGQGGGGGGGASP